MARTVQRRRYQVTEMYALIEISSQMLEHSAFGHAGRHSVLRWPSMKYPSVVQWLRRGPVAGSCHS